MISRFLADLVLILHFAFIVFAVAGGLVVLYRRRVIWVHLPVVLWASMVNLAEWGCPLTPLENALRVSAGQAGYAGGFVQHYIAPVVYPAAMPHELALIAGVSILVWNALVYVFVTYRWRRHP